jgi:response regulator of citrate/malate metabolism
MIGTLIVEDDYHVAKIHAAYVRKVAGFAVVGHAPSAATARSEIKRLAPALVLLDLYLPDGNGLDIVRESVTSTGQRPDFLVITAARDVASVRSAMQLGTVHYLVKPFTFTQIEERLIAYRDLRSKLARTTEAGQHEVDTLYRLLRGPAPPSKGQSGPTMAAIRELLQAAPRGLSATEVAEKIGISRATAQRYLAELARQGRAELSLHYGATGRPEHRYTSATPPG